VVRAQEIAGAIVLTSKPMLKLTTTLTLLFLSAQVFAQQPDYGVLKRDAEKLYAEKSYAAANQLYAQAERLKLRPQDARWVAFRLADTLWRAEAGSNSADSTKFDQAREKLELLERDVKSPEDQIWAEVQESLGDFWWTRTSSQNWGQAAAHYQKALEWWAGQRDLDAARTRYLQLVWRAVAPAWMEMRNGGYYGNSLPLEILDNAVKISREPVDQARAHYFLTMRLRMTGAWEERQRVPEELESALKAGKSSDWYDDALYAYAEWMASTGTITQLENGEWRQQPDYLKALALFERITSEFKKGETRYYDEALAQIDNIRKPTVGVLASNIFLPDSEIQLNLSWRNVRHISLTVYPVVLARDVNFTHKDQNSGDWINRINLAGRVPAKSWSKETRDDGTHQPGQEVWRPQDRLPAGAYVVEARDGTASAREIILVTDASLVLKTSGKQALLYFCDAVTGAPISQANTRLWEKIYNTGKQEWIWRQTEKTTNQDGIATFDLTSADNSYHEIFASAAGGENHGRQAFSLGNRNSNGRNEQPWRIYAFTDRPAYRPQETMQWKFVVRKLNDSVYSTPAGQTIEYEILDPKGNKVKEDKVVLNAFGSVWGTLDLTTAMPLGAYQVRFYDQGRQHTIGDANLFRLEEYKLPEFKVQVQTPLQDGQRKVFRLGEKVEATVTAEYYFGGAVADASVEVVVYQRAFYRYWQPYREYPWYYSDMYSQGYQYGPRQGQIIKRETLKTGADGKAALVFDTPRNAGQDLEYFIEARVTDSSRREITGSDTVRVSRQRYYVYPRAAHNLYKPNDKVEVNFKSLDANDQPVPVSGQVKVTRDYYYEIWLDPTGRAVQGPELKRIREQLSARGLQFPPTLEKDGKRWRLAFQGYQHEDIATLPVKTDASGEGIASFTPAREGYYRATWTSPDKGGPVVQAETTVWVTTSRTTDLGYRQGGLEIIVDKDTFRPGDRAPVMLTTSVPDRYVLFSVEGDDIYKYQLVHLTGTTTLLDLPVEEKYVPNIFLSAAMVSDRQIFLDTKQVIVPPVEHFLNVEVKADRAEYQPREEGTLNITTTDRQGRPVAAEVALGLIDSSVFYIQQDTSGDPRQFYFGSKRVMRSQTQSTFQQKAYAKLVEGPGKQLIDQKTLEQDRENDTPFSRLQTLADLSRAPGAGRDRAKSYNAEYGAVSESVEVRSDSDDRFSNLPVNGRKKPESNFSLDGVNKDEAQSAIQVRNDFRSTIFWQPDVVTDASGQASVKIKYPDSLTAWTATARAITAGDKFGIASAETHTKKPLIIRLEAPRFFVVGDRSLVSAVINNNTDHAMTVSPSLDAEGVVIKGQVKDGHHANTTPGPVTVPANGEQHVDWEVGISNPGTVKLKVSARSDTQADAMERELTAYEHGIEKLVARSGKMRGDEVTIRLDIPGARKPESTKLSVQVAPSMAVTMLDALPYLIDYPYGCTEQTMSRFLPAAITAKTLKDLGLPPEAAMEKIFGGIERETAAQTHPKGKRDLRELDRIVKAGLDRLYNMQHTDGGWGWWKEDSTDHFMTAYALWGLTLARDAGIEVKPEAISQGLAFVDTELVKEENAFDMQAWMLHAGTAAFASENRRAGGSSAINEFQAKAFDNLWNNRERLNAYTRSLLALSAHNLGYNEKAQTLIRNLENGVKVDRTPDTSIIDRGGQATSDSVIGTAHWGEDGIYYRWSDGGIEATAFALRAMLTIDPGDKLIEPVTNWLIKNRRGAQWSNTRDTAITILALNDYIRASGETMKDLEYEIVVNGHPLITKRITAADGLSAPSRFEIDNKYVQDGANEISVRRRSGTGPLYFAAEARFFSLEEPIKSAGNELFVRREYYRLVPHQTLLKGIVYDRVVVRDGDTIQSGERVDVVVTIEAKNNYEYLLFEDLKPAGLEAVQLRSGDPLSARELKSGAVLRKFAGTNTAANNTDSSDASRQLAVTNSPDEANKYTGRDSFVYQELRDRKVAMFVSNLPQGVWEIRYALRAEVPGTFHALPLMGQAMYVPEIRCNDEEMIVRVVDK
jgi:uncharacterized protein YfaS (alpha-2-macroglobulin family)